MQVQESNVPNVANPTTVGAPAALRKREREKMINQKLTVGTFPPPRLSLSVIDRCHSSVIHVQTELCVFLEQIDAGAEE